MSKPLLVAFTHTKDTPVELCRRYEINFASFYVSGKLLTYPSPKPTLTLTSHVGQNAGLGRGR